MEYVTITIVDLTKIFLVPGHVFDYVLPVQRGSPRVGWTKDNPDLRQLFVFIVHDNSFQL